MQRAENISWLLEGDVSIQFQIYRDLLDTERPDLQLRIASEGWGKRFLNAQKPNGHWGLKFYQPKWTSTHYTLLDLKNLNIHPDTIQITNTIEMILNEEKGEDGGINPAGTINKSDVCINGMFLNYACYFKAGEEQLKSIIDYICLQQMPDGGFNCQFNRSGAKHSSLHSTISVLEGFWEYLNNGYTYRKSEILNMKAEAEQFILCHKLFRSDKSGEIIHKNFLKFTYPSRWRYDVLRALDYFRETKHQYDQRMKDSIDVLASKRNNNGLWLMQAKHPGQVHFKMEEARKPSRWNTLRALRVLNFYSN